MGTVTCEDPRMEDLRKRLSESLKVKTSNGEDIRLTYFPARGRAEISRLILTYAAVKYDDIRLTGEEFGKVKPILPYGSVPILEHKGEADEIVLGINGIFESVAKCIFAPEGEKAGLKKKLIEETLPLKLGQLEARLCLRGGQFFAGNALTYADLMVVVLQDNLRSAVIGAGSCIEKFPKLCSLYERVIAVPNIKAWRGARPVDPMFNN